MSQNLFNPPKRVDVDLSPYAGQNAYSHEWGEFDEEHFIFLEGTV